MTAATWGGKRMGTSGKCRRGRRVEPECRPVGPQEGREEGAETALGRAALPREPDGAGPEPGPRRERRDGPADPRLAGRGIHEVGDEAEVLAQLVEHDP